MVTNMMPNPTPEIHKADYAAFAAAHPAEASLLQTAVATAVQQVEQDQLSGPEKKAAAEKLTLEILNRVYDGVDLFLNLHPAVDFIAKDFLIPLIPKAIDGIVALFNQTGIFEHGK
jgi:hypothetical protein